MYLTVVVRKGELIAPECNLYKCVAEDKGDFCVTSEWVVQAGHANAMGFDTDTPLQAKTANQIKTLGYAYCLRYLPIEPYVSTNGDLDNKELNLILDSRLALMPVQHVRVPGWRPTRSLGLCDGHLARVAAYRAGIPANVNVWLDLEGIHDTTSHSVIAAYVNAWYDVVSAWGYRPGIYVGSQSLLSASELFHSIRVKHYWKSKSDVPTPVTRGYQMIQTRSNVQLSGIAVDEDRTQVDALGDSVQWLVKKA